MQTLFTGRHSIWLATLVRFDSQGLRKHILPLILIHNTLTHSLTRQIEALHLYTSPTNTRIRVSVSVHYLCLVRPRLCSKHASYLIHLFSVVLKYFDNDLHWPKYKCQLLFLVCPVLLCSMRKLTLSFRIQFGRYKC